ncbi:MAG TPA: hypothetical protein VFF33_02955, partial [Ignavibacteriaceae bacterium]|nr:hypothetical protein [Ignavibacteriaceae bacterium]
MITFNPLKSISLNNNHLNSRSIIFSLILSLVISTITFSASNYNPRMNNQKDLLFSSPSEWIICGPNSWEELKNYLPEAKMSGVTIKVVILPPFQSTNICTEGSYSEPFQNNYIRWAQEIAKLSLRYSNIVQYEIYQLRENLNLGYLRRAYIDSMIVAGKTLNPKLQFTTPYKIFFVDKNATGNGNGTSWTNAATSIAAINWSQLGSMPNDTIYISGGTDSIVYAKQIINMKGSRNYEVTIAPSWESGHNGDVIFENADSSHSSGYNILIYKSSKIKFTSFTFRSTAPFIQYGDENL